MSVFVFVCVGGLGVRVHVFVLSLVEVTPGSKDCLINSRETVYACL